MLVQTTTNKLLVSVKSKYSEALSDISRVAALQNDSSISITDFITIVGEIESIPIKIENTRRYMGFTAENLKVGDKCIFSYRVIYDLVVAKEDEPNKFRNQLILGGKEYFACDITDLFAVIRDNEIIMQNGYVMVSEFFRSNIILPKYIRKAKGTVKAQVLNIGHSLTTDTPISVNQGDWVHFNPNKAQPYKINGKPFCILQQSQILGKLME